MANEVKSLSELYPDKLPTPLARAVGYHEAGHAILAAHYGLVIQYMWIGQNGRKMAPPDLPGMRLFDGSFTNDEAGSSGVTLSSLVLDRDDVIAIHNSKYLPVYVAIGAAVTEEITGKALNYKEMAKEYPDFFPEGTWVMSRGGGLDLQRAFAMMMPAYLKEHLTPMQAAVGFSNNILIPAVGLVNNYMPQINALVDALVEKAFLPGKEVHEILCKAGVGHVRLPGCTCEGNLTDKFVAMFERAIQMNKEDEKQAAERKTRIEKIYEGLSPEVKEKIHRLDQVLRPLLGL